MAEASDTGDVPRFACSLFGYDRYQVDDYVVRLLDRAADADRRAAEAELRAAARDEELRAQEAEAIRFDAEPVKALIEKLDRFAGALKRLEQELNGSGGS